MSKSFLQQHNRTKIVATVGPASSSEEMLTALVKAGVDVFRVNMAHGSREQHQEVVDRIRAVEEKIAHPIAILVDLAGPKIRLGTLPSGQLDCALGNEFSFVRSAGNDGQPEAVGQMQSAKLTSNYAALVDELSIGDRVLLADGAVGMEVIGKSEDVAHCKVTDSGVIRNHQGINLPGVALNIPALTERDRDNAVWAAQVEADFVSLSFVRSPEDIVDLKQRLAANDSHAMVIAKIEKPEALERLEEIVTATDGVMVARGDLGVEIDVARTPIAQKEIIAECSRQGKPVIVATQMLDSMQHSPRPTRAEASDVANAILDGADACMLSGETAVGDFPVETVEMMNRIMLHTEERLRGQPSQETANTTVHPITSAVVFGAARIARQLQAKLVVMVTRSGATALAKAKQRDFIPTIGISKSRRILRRMNLFWGVLPITDAPSESGPELRRFISQWGIANGCLESGDRVVLITGTGVAEEAHNLVVVHEVQ